MEKERKNEKASKKVYECITCMSNGGSVSYSI